MKFKLFFDTSDRNQIIVKLFKNNEIIASLVKEQQLTSQALLPLIEEIFKILKISTKDIFEIEINQGPGSYTGLKVGAAVANALGWFLDIPVNGKKNNIVNPVYK